MSTHHTVQQGESLAKIAAQYGFANLQTIWDRPENAALQTKRPNPNVLFPEDSLFIPDKQMKTETVGTAQLHRFKVHRPKVLLRIVLKNIDDQPLADTACDLRVESKVYLLTTDGAGQIEQEIPATAEKANLTFKDPMILLDIQEIKIGHLDPVEEISGQRARLCNLGYYLGSLDDLDEEDETQLHAAIEEFQCEHGLTVDGICGPKTQNKLMQAYDS